MSLRRLCAGPRFRLPALFVVAFCSVGGASAAGRQAMRVAPSRTEKLEAIKANVAVALALRTLHEHPRMIALRPHIAHSGPIAFSMGGEDLVLYADGLKVRRGSAEQPIGLEQLVELGVTQPAHLEAVFDEATRRVAGALHLTQSRQIQDRLQTNSLLRNPAQHADLALLAAYINASAPGINRHLKPDLVLHTKGLHTLALSHSGDRTELRTSGTWGFVPTEVVKTETLQAANEPLLISAGVPDVKTLNDVIANRLLQITGVEGNASDPNLVMQARAALVRQLPTIAELRTIMLQPRSHPSLALGIELSAAMNHGQETPFVFARHKGLALAILTFEKDSFTREPYVALVNAKTLAIENLRTKSMRGTNKVHLSATWEELRQVNIRSRADLDAAVEDTLIDLYPSLPIAGGPEHPHGDQRQ